MPARMDGRRIGVYEDRHSAWTACRQYASALVALEMTPEWGVDVRCVNHVWGVWLCGPPDASPAATHAALQGISHVVTQRPAYFTL